MSVKEQVAERFRRMGYEPTEEPHRIYPGYWQRREGTWSWGVQTKQAFVGSPVPMTEMLKCRHEWTNFVIRGTTDVEFHPCDACQMGSRTAAPVDNDYSDSVMICLVPDSDVQDAFAQMKICTEDKDDLHITLFYLGSMEDCGGPAGKERLYRACYGHSIAGARPLVGKANGFGVFMNPDSDVLVALFDIPYVAEFRAALGGQCRDHGVPMREEDHGFTPHMTVSYDDGKIRELPEIPSGGRAEQTFDSFWLVWGEEWNEIPMVSVTPS